MVPLLYAMLVAGILALVAFWFALESARHQHNTRVLAAYCQKAIGDNERLTKEIDRVIPFAEPVEG